MICLIEGTVTRTANLTQENSNTVSDLFKETALGVFYLFTATAHHKYSLGCYEALRTNGLSFQPCMEGFSFTQIRLLVDMLSFLA